MLRVVWLRRLSGLKSLGQVPMIDWAAHAFGMVGGLLLNMYLESTKFQGRKRVVMKYGGAGLYASLIVIGFAVLFTVVKHSPK
jgi:hypothetical protein